MVLKSLINIFKIEPDPKRIFGLDILRAAAILFVLIPHGGFLLPQKLKMGSNAISLDGVSIFFVLSGFLIGGILIKTIEKETFTKKALFHFWMRRWFRTLPNYFLILIFLCIFNYYFTDDFTLDGVYKYFIFSQNLAEPHPAKFFPEAWSLSVEEWFYLLIPILIFLLVTLFRMKAKYSVLVCAISVIVAITLFRYVRFENTVISNFGDWDLVYRKQVFTRLDSLMFGVLGAYLQYYCNKFWLQYQKRWLLVGILLMLASKLIARYITDPAGLYSCVFSFTLISMGTLFLLPFLSNLKAGKGWFYYGITYISLISYSMYLLNLSVVQRCIINKVAWGSFFDSEYTIAFIRYLLYWILVFLFSILLYKYYEMPMTRLRESKNK